MSAGGMALASTAKNVKSAPYKVMNATRNKSQNRDNKKLENPRDSEEFNKANASSLLNRNADEKRLGNYTQSKNEDEIKRKSDEKLQEERLKARRRAKEKLEMQREMLRRATERKRAQKKQTTSERVQRRMTKYNYDKEKNKV